ncbi:MAG: hypothetical protein UT30_C0003G0039 [Candidatus Uhrbacteria bacterium GW2011_GWF2_39_13]|uniref:Uncharacterized protein n=1 Tax=Candidatus Uhrbacteria bacterium GW2011_GWF2_39_13 TaxID=1618995 RepID=A0A0G0Q358_9BACT|nr:MAG: hypothetical protein UT30_C0003G0039 [Candidatus Uhrbacteria bacterium GW2011_GWF2_39_13]HAU66245.1 hypothetical protein [Candidatus Uhrbacteria bacterium]
MSKSLNRAALNFSRFSPPILPATLGRRGGGRGQTIQWGVIALDVLIAQNTPRLNTDEVFETREESQIEDHYSRLDAALESVGGHELVREWGFAPDQLIDQSDYENPKPIDATILSVWVEACEFATALGRIETFKVLGIEDKDQTLPSIGKVLFFKGTLIAARIVEIENQKKKEEERKKMTSSIPRRQSVAQTPRQIPAAPSEKPEGSNHLGQIELAPGVWGYTCACGCGQSMKPEFARVPGFDDMRDRQGGDRVKVVDLWRHAFNPACVYGLPSFKLVDTRAKMEEYEAETARRQAEYRAEQERRESIRLQAEARKLAEAKRNHTRSTGKTAGNRAKMPGQAWQDTYAAYEARFSAPTARSLGELGSLFNNLPRKAA